MEGFAMNERNVVVVMHWNRNTHKWTRVSEHAYENEDQALKFMEFHQRQIVDNPQVKTILVNTTDTLEWWNSTDTRVRVTVCPSCKNTDDRGPSHEPSRNCMSGKRPHCSCDTCF